MCAAIISPVTLPVFKYWAQFKSKKVTLRTLQSSWMFEFTFGGVLNVRHNYPKVLLTVMFEWCFDNAVAVVWMMGSLSFSAYGRVRTQRWRTMATLIDWPGGRTFYMYCILMFLYLKVKLLCVSVLQCDFMAACRTLGLKINVFHIFCTIWQNCSLIGKFTRDYYLDFSVFFTQNTP